MPNSRPGHNTPKATSLVSHSPAKIGYSRSSISSVMTSKKRKKGEGRRTIPSLFLLFATRNFCRNWSHFFNVHFKFRNILDLRKGDHGIISSSTRILITTSSYLSHLKRKSCFSLYIPFRQFSRKMIQREEGDKQQYRVSVRETSYSGGAKWRAPGNKSGRAPRSIQRRA